MVLKNIKKDYYFLKKGKEKNNKNIKI